VIDVRAPPYCLSDNLGRCFFLCGLLLLFSCMLHHHRLSNSYILQFYSSSPLSLTNVIVILNYPTILLMISRHKSFIAIMLTIQELLVMTISYIFFDGVKRGLVVRIPHTKVGSRVSFSKMLLLSLASSALSTTLLYPHLLQVIKSVGYGVLSCVLNVMSSDLAKAKHQLKLNMQKLSLIDFLVSDLLLN